MIHVTISRQLHVQNLAKNYLINELSVLKVINKHTKIASNEVVVEPSLLTLNVFSALIQFFY